MLLTAVHVQLQQQLLEQSVVVLHVPHSEHLMPKQATRRWGARSSLATYHAEGGKQPARLVTATPQGSAQAMLSQLGSYRQLTLKVQLPAIPSMTACSSDIFTVPTCMTADTRYA